MAYDNRGNLTQTVDAMKRRVNYTYDADCHLLSVSINGKERLKNHYDAKGNLAGTENLYGNRVAVKMMKQEDHRQLLMRMAAF